MSEIRANTVSDAAGTGPATLTGQYAAKAWVNFNGTGTVAIRDSENVSSITDNGTGDYTVNFSNAFANSNYAPVASNSVSFGVAPVSIQIATQTEVAPTTSALRFATMAGNFNTFDTKYTNMSFQGDLA